jgi:cytochrome c oxidase subunit 1
VVFLLIGGILAIGVVLTRWPAVHWLEADTFYHGAHGARHRHADLLDHLLRDRGAVLLFIDAAAMPIATPKIAWLAFALMLIGAVVNNVAVFQGARA